MMGGETFTTAGAASGDADETPAERLNARAASELAERLESLLARLESLPDQPVRTVALEAVESLVQLYGEGLARMVARIERCGDRSLTRALADDELVAHLLLLHGLHPDDTAARVKAAIDDLSSYLHAHGCTAELIAVDGEVARVRLAGLSHGYASTRHTLRSAVEGAVLRVAPEISDVEIAEEVEVAPALVSITGPRRDGSRSRDAADAAVGARHDPQHSSPLP